MRGFVRLLDPIVRPLDKLVGERVAMKIEVDMQDGTNATGLYVHKRLSESVGIATAAFVHNMLAGERTRVWVGKTPAGSPPGFGRGVPGWTACVWCRCVTTACLCVTTGCDVWT